MWRPPWPLISLCSVVLCAVLGAVGCTAPPIEAPAPRHADLGTALVASKLAEARDPNVVEPYLRTIEVALAHPEDPWSLAAVLASLEALVWRDVPGVVGDHAIVHRSSEALVTTATRLQRLWATAGRAPLARGLIATALHDLALRVGAMEAASTWRRRAGCPVAVTLAGPLGFPPLSSLERPSVVPSRGALPDAFVGVAPFEKKVTPETVYTDACIVDLRETSALRGERAVVVDLDREQAGPVYVAVTTSNAARLEIGGALVLERPFGLGGSPVTRFGVAHLEAGRTRVVLRVADNADGRQVAMQLWDGEGQPVVALDPRPGTVASGTAKSAHSVDVLGEPDREHLPLAMAALLASGETRRALSLVESDLAPPAAQSPVYLELLRIEAIERADAIPRNQAMLELQAAARRAAEGCPDCWEPKIALARAESQRKGLGTGVYDVLAELGVTPDDPSWTSRLGIMELAWVATAASGANLDDIGRLAFDTVAARAPGSLLVADLDAALFRRVGPELVQAACEGGTSRAGRRCLQALLARPGLEPALREMHRLRRLRGSPALYRDLEMIQLLSHGRRDEAMAIYDALPVAQRRLAALGIDVGTPQQDEARAAFARDQRDAADAPWAYEPLVRLLGLEPDPAAHFDPRGAALVARDREKAFLPGAGAAVLDRVERYELDDSGLLHYLIYDLRRVSGTVDVADGTWMGAPMIAGRNTSRMVRRRIFKKDGRVLDPDPSARGQQGNTDLSQLEAGDYVEALLVGWALPEDHGQLTVDTPDLLPERTSVQQGSITFLRPADLDILLWSHPLLGDGRSDKRPDGRRATTWTLSEERPRTLESGVPPLESRVAISFGTDSYDRIAAAMADRYRALDEDDPFVARWLAEEVPAGGAPAERVAAIVAAVGKALERPDPSALGDFVASMGGGDQRETARWMIEQGTGSRTWVVHRALRAAGIESQIAVAESQPFSAAPGFPPHPGRFTHPLVRVDVDGQPLWIDADVAGPPLPPGKVSPELRGRMALLADGSMVRVEAEAGADVDEVALALRLDAEGRAEGTFAVTIHGRPAQQLSDALEVVVGSTRDQMLRNVVIGWIPEADVRSVKLEGGAGSYQLRITAEVAFPRFAEPSDRERPRYTIAGMPPIHDVQGRPSTGTLGARYASQAERQGALAIDQPLLYRVERRIALPAAAVVAELPVALDVKDANVEASRTVAREGDVLVDRFELNLPVGTVEASAFEAFAERLRTIDDGFQHGIRIELPSK